MKNFFAKNNYLLKLFNIFAEYGGELRLVGGCVRDLLIEEEIQDIDIAVNLLPEQVMKVCDQHNIKYIKTGLKHGTITVVIDGNAIEITTLRRDIKCDGRHAITEFTDDWQEDAARRDFTFNALYCDVNGKIYDYFNGRQDLSKRHVRFVGDIEKRICEDYLRILRAFRFHAQLVCEQLDHDILKICNQYAKKIDCLSAERIKQEMLKLFSFENALLTLTMMKGCGVLDWVMPVKIAVCDQAEFCCGDALINLACILRANNICDSAKLFFKKWHLSKQQYKNLDWLCNVNYSVEPAKQKGIILAVGKELYLQGLIILYYEEKIDWQTLCDYREFAINWQVPKLPINGDDLIEIGYQRGENLKIILSYLGDYWAQNNYNLSKKTLKNYAISLLKKQWLI